MDFRLPSSDIRLPTSVFRLWVLFRHIYHEVLEAAQVGQAQKSNRGISSFSPPRIAES